ncbi:MAG: type II toxin-antitoxin system VapC family toxin [Lacisediminihabitans sp.]
MIAYFDTSAIVPLLITEPASDRCRELWDSAERIATSRIACVEAAAALARAFRADRITELEHDALRTSLEDYWRDVDAADLDQNLAVAAAEAAYRHGLRGYDAVHCAAAERLHDLDLVAVSGDRHLLRIWSSLGINVVDVGRA